MNPETNLNELGCRSIVCSSARVASARAIALSLVVACVAFCVVCGKAGSGPTSSGPPQTFDFFRMVDAIDNPLTIPYAYAPSIVLKDNVYHFFFCSGGNIFPAWDYIRYVESTDGGQTWSTPVDKLHATAFNGMDLSACDPSVVYFGGFYYMYYGSAITTAPHGFHTVIHGGPSHDAT